MENKESFEYTYSAAQRAEVENIRKKYMQPREDKLEQLRRLDQSASAKAQVRSLTLGIIGVLILGTGMSLVMTELGRSLGTLALVLGISVGLVGLVMVALAYPVYNKILKTERARIAPEILRLSEELMQ